MSRTLAWGCRRLSPWQTAEVKSWMLVALAPLVWAGCSRGAGGDDTDGRAIFQTMCATCHGPDGRPPAAMVARLGVRDLTAPELRARVTPALVAEQVRTGSKNKLMPSFAGAISDAQIAAVAAFVASPQFVAPP
ncbi:MAG TPA: c-type cytochrome [Kofleriaceae bacterium]|nr:c-type cytochrome [Kofleriaceae bacterium]